MRSVSASPRPGLRRSVLLVVAALVPLATAGCGAGAHRDEPTSSPSSTTRPSGASSETPENGPLAGRTVVIDPGHNPHNNRHVEEISQLVDIGTKKKRCDTTGTATNDGYREAEFTLDVSRRVRTLLERRGATVQLTQDGDRAVGAVCR